MRLAAFTSNGAAHVGIVIGDELVDLSRAAPYAPQSIEDLIQSTPDVIARLDELQASSDHRVALSEVTLRAPVTPRKFFAIGLNYADHIAETGLAVPEHMVVFAKAVSCVSPPYGPIERPAVSEQLDYEGELGIVIGRRCRNVPVEKAAEAIAGYVVINDVSVRDWQTQTTQWTLGKSFDTHGPIGPWLVTRDEIDDPHSLDIRTFVNDELRQSSNTRHLIFNCFEQVAHLSQVCTLEPGDVIATGTPGGVAVGLPGTPWLVPGDVVRVEIEKIGEIENTVVQGTAVPVI